MLIFAISDKGGTGRSVTSGNVLYRMALGGADVCYVDFDFGSPTAGTTFHVGSAANGTRRGGLHSYLFGNIPSPQRLSVWTESERAALRGKLPGAGELVLYPGDENGGEFPSTTEVVARSVDLFARLEEEFEITLVDLSAGRSYAAQIALAASASTQLLRIPSRWLVFHRWTRQHIAAASGLVNGENGIVAAGAAMGHDAAVLRANIRYVRTAVVDPETSPELAALRPQQLAWLRACNDELHDLASRLSIGRTVLLGTVPLDPVLQWREQLITDEDVMGSKIANYSTVHAFRTLADLIRSDESWEPL